GVRQIGTIPVGNARGLFHQRRKSLFRGRITACIQSEKLERGSDVLDLHMRRLGTRRAEIFDDLRPDDGGEQAEDRENDEEFEESKAILAFIACVHCDTAKSLKPRIAVIIDAIIAATAPPSRTVMSGV